MPTDHFSKADFESALPKTISTGKLIGGEWVYRLTLNEVAAIDIRSTVDSSDYAADTGDDSIRCWLLNPKTGKAIAPKVDAWTTRVSGWQTRLTGKIEMLSIYHKRAGVCSKCNKPRSIWMAQNGKNAGHLMAKCFDCNDWPSKAVVDDPITTEEHKWFSGFCNNSTPPPMPSPAPSPAPQAKTPETSTIFDLIKPTDSKVEISQEEPTTGLASVIPHNGKTKTPTPEQQAAIDAPAGTDNRIMAGPGAGKTYVVEQRYLHLVTECNVKDSRILVVTYANQAADELLRRISKVVKLSPDAANRVSTIHALCRRILKFEGDPRDYPQKEWEVNVILQNLSETIWPNAEDRPGKKEIKLWIDLAKYYGMTTANDLRYYVDHLGEYHGRKQHEARRQFDAIMRGKNYMTFEDMIFDVEQRLITDSAFRSRWQGQFDEVIIDEGQDTNAQALRILITLSLAPGDNRIYANWRPGQQF